MITMRMVKFEDCEYEDFYKKRLLILRDIPYALLNAEYLKEDKIAYFYFWDSDYVPEAWKPWIVRPTNVNSDKEGVSEEYASSQGILNLNVTQEEYEAFVKAWEKKTGKKYVRTKIISPDEEEATMD